MFLLALVQTFFCSKAGMSRKGVFDIVMMIYLVLFFSTIPGWLSWQPKERQASLPDSQGRCAPWARADHGGEGAHSWNTGLSGPGDPAARKTWYQLDMFFLGAGLLYRKLNFTQTICELVPCPLRGEKLTGLNFRIFLV